MKKVRETERPASGEGKDAVESSSQPFSVRIPSNFIIKDGAQVFKSRNNVHLRVQPENVQCEVSLMDAFELSDTRDSKTTRRYWNHHQRQGLCKRQDEVAAPSGEVCVWSHEAATPSPSFNRHEEGEFRFLLLSHKAKIKISVHFHSMI